jgi:hypothetical protein
MLAKSVVGNSPKSLSVKRLQRIIGLMGRDIMHWSKRKREHVGTVEPVPSWQGIASAANRGGRNKIVEVFGCQRLRIIRPAGVAYRSQLQARYHPVIISAALGTAMIFLRRFQLLWVQPATIFILISLCAAQTAADIAATRRWNAYITDLQSQLVNGRGVIPWETTLHPADERADIDGRLSEIGWVIPYICMVYAPGGIVNAIIDPPADTNYRPLSRSVLIACRDCAESIMDRTNVSWLLSNPEARHSRLVEAMSPNHCFGQACLQN